MNDAQPTRRQTQIATSRFVLQVFDPTRKWSGALRELFRQSEIAVEPALDLAELCEAGDEARPRLGAVYIQPDRLATVANEFRRRFTTSSPPVLAILDGPDGETADALRRIGFSIVVSGLEQMDRVKKLAKRYFATLPIREIPLEQLIEQSLPWRPLR